MSAETIRPRQERKSPREGNFWEPVLMHRERYPPQLVKLCEYRQRLEEGTKKFRGQSGAAPEPMPLSVKSHLPGFTDQTTALGRDKILFAKKVLSVANGADPRSIVGFHASATGAGDSLLYLLGLNHKYFGGTAYVVDIGPFSDRMHRQIEATGAPVKRLFVERGRALTPEEAEKSAEEAVHDMRDKRKEANAVLNEAMKNYPEARLLVREIAKRWGESNKLLILGNRIERVRETVQEARELKDEVLPAAESSGFVEYKDRKYSSEELNQEIRKILEPSFKVMEKIKSKHPILSRFFEESANHDPFTVDWSSLSDELFSRAYDLRFMEPHQLLTEAHEKSPGLARAVRIAYEKQYASQMSPTYIMTDLDTGTGARNPVHTLVDTISNVFEKANLPAPYFVIDATSSAGVNLSKLSKRKVSVYEGTTKPYGTPHMSFVSSTESGRRYLEWYARSVKQLGAWTKNREDPRKRTLIPPVYLDWLSELDAQRTGGRARYTQVGSSYLNVADNILFSLKRTAERNPLHTTLTSSQLRERGVKAEEATRDILAKFSDEVMKVFHFTPYNNPKDRSSMASVYKQPSWFVEQEAGTPPKSLIPEVLNLAGREGAEHHFGYAGVDALTWKKNIDANLAKLSEPHKGIVRINHYLPRDADLNNKMDNILILGRKIAEVINKRSELEPYREIIPQNLDKKLQEIKDRYLEEYSKKSLIPVSILKGPLSK